MEEEQSGEGRPTKTDVTSRARHDLRNMRLTGKERDLSSVLGNLITARIGPTTQERVIDLLMSETPQKAKRDEVALSLSAAGIHYDVEVGIARQRARDEAVDRYLQQKRESERTASRNPLENI